MGYWPHYGKISGHNRLAYLSWLASGRCDPKADLGYVFLYFYGLEYRMFYESPTGEKEAQQIVDEVNRLRSVYGKSISFGRYADSFLEHAEMVSLLRYSAAAKRFQPLAPDGEPKSHKVVRVAMASKIAHNQSIDAALAAAYTLSCLGKQISGNTDWIMRVRPEFDAYFAHLYSQSFPFGVRPEQHQAAPLNLDYRPAREVNARLNLASSRGASSAIDPNSLGWGAMIEVANQAAAGLKDYYNVVSPKTTGKLTFGAIGTLPDVLIKHSPEVGEQIGWLRANANPVGLVEFGELAERALGLRSDSWSPRHLKRTEESIAPLGYTIEAPQLPARHKLSNTTKIALIHARREEATIFVATLQASLFLLSSMRWPDQEVAVELYTSWLKLATEVPDATSADQRIIQGRLFLALIEPVKSPLPKARRALLGRSEVSRRTALSLVVAAISAVGLDTKENIAALESAYRGFGIDKDELYAALNGGVPSTQAYLGPVTVETGRQALGHAIPQPRAVKKQPPSPLLDREKIKAVQAETEKVSSDLAQIFMEETPIDPLEHPSRQVAEHPRFQGLDPKLAQVLERLLEQQKWTRVAYEDIARGQGQMPDGAMEAINEWSLEQYDAVILEDGDPVFVDHSILPPGAPREAAATDQTKRTN
jgi:hypothetical protein